MLSLSNKLKLFIRLVLVSLAAPQLRGAETEKPLVATLHPLLTEMVSRIAGDYVRIEELMGPGRNPHTYDPTPGDLSRIQNASMVVAMGKNLETYLDRLQSALPDDVPIYEAGRLVPSLRIDVENEIFMCCPSHSHGAIDPHWWQSPMAVHRATRHLGRELEKFLPDHRTEIRANTRKYMDEIEALHEWVRTRIAAIPRQQRILVTAHAAFGYFCEAYGFRTIPVQGLTTERDPTPSYLAETIDTIRKENIRAVFPDLTANQNILQLLAEETGVTLGEPLLADNTIEEGTSYSEMIRHNVEAIVAALAPESDD